MKKIGKFVGYFVGYFVGIGGNPPTGGSPVLDPDPTFDSTVFKFDSDLFTFDKEGS